MNKLATGIPVIDFKPFLESVPEARIQVAKEIGLACENDGFFGLRNFGIDSRLLFQLEQKSHEFFRLPLNEKMQIEMKKGGRAWRGFFPVGDELTSQRPDLKEGLYFGEELSSADPRVQEAWPLHGANLFPALPGFRDLVLRYMEAQTRLGQSLMQALGLGLGLPENYLFDHFTTNPTVLFRIFHYPPVSAETEKKFPWGVGEHTDYGLLTMLAQDDCGGLQVKVEGEWISIPPMEGVLICNVGDMLDFMTMGKYRSVPHRVKNLSGKSRLSFPFFFDPSFSAKMARLPIEVQDLKKRPDRWDQANLYQFDGTYGEYLTNKVAKVFPQLKT